LRVFYGEFAQVLRGGTYMENLVIGREFTISSIDGQKEVFGKKFLSAQSESDNEWNSIDSTINRAHQHAAGARKGEEIAIGRSKGGLTTKVHMLADAHGNPREFVITEGQVHDMKEAATLAEISDADVFLGDKGYDSEALREMLLKKGVLPVIPRKKNSSKPNPSFDEELYKARHTIENLFAKMKEFRGFATRYDKLKRNYAAVVAIVCSEIWFRLLTN
jgi:transposase